MSDVSPKRRWYRLTPDRFMVVVLLALVGLFVADQYSLYGLERGDLRNVQIAAAVVGGAVVLTFACLILGVLLRRRPQFGIRWLLLLTVAVAISSSWYAACGRLQDRRRIALVAIQEAQARNCKGEKFRQFCCGHGKELEFAPGARKQIIGVSFDIKQEFCSCGCSYDPVQTDVSDEDLELFSCLYRLERLEVPHAEITDAGLAYLGGLTRLRYLDLGDNAITDAGLVHLRDLTSLRHLNLGSTRITDAGLVHLRGLTNLEHLDLENTEITDAGFAHLAGLKKLEELRFRETFATGAGLKHLAGCKTLRSTSPPVLGVDGANALSSMEGLVQSYGLIARPSPGSKSRPVVTIDGLPKLNRADLRYGMHLDSIHVSNLPLLEIFNLTEGPCIHEAQWRRPASARRRVMTCMQCDRDVTEIRLENLPELWSLEVGNVQRLMLRNVPNLSKFQLKTTDGETQIIKIDQGRQAPDRTLTLLRPPDCVVRVPWGRFTGLDKLTLPAAGLTEAALADLGEVKCLWLVGTGAAVPGLEQLRNLKSLEVIEAVSILEPGESLGCLRELPRLREIRFRQVTGGTLKLSGMPSLTKIDLAACRFDVLELSNLPVLKTIQSQGDIAIGRLSLKSLPKLEVVSVNPQIVSVSLDHVELADLPNLHTLRLPGDIRPPYLRDECLKNVATFLNLTHLDVSNSEITDRTIERLLELPQLDYVRLNKTDTTEAAANRLRESRPGEIEVLWSRKR